MPKTGAYRWRGWRTDLQGGTIKSGPVKKKGERKITNSQAGYLAHLQCQLGVPYTGRGLTAKAAAAQISQAKLAVERQRAAQARRLTDQQRNRGPAK